MDIIKLIDKKTKKKSKEIKIYLKNNKKYTVSFEKDNKLNIIFNKNSVLNSKYNFYGILDKNDFWIWSTSIPGTHKLIIKNVNKIKNLSHLFENNNNKRMLFYHQLLTQNMILITDKKQIKWINNLLIYLDDSIYYLNPISHRNNIQFITLSKIYHNTQ